MFIISFALLFQILNCVGSLTRSVPEVEVRRAAAMFVHKLLEGLGSDTLKVGLLVYNM